MSSDWDFVKKTEKKQTLEDRIKELEKRVAELEKKVAQLQKGQKK
jgi:polyhydroxyalkanoate synthesis regulator phasin